MRRSLFAVAFALLVGVFGAGRCIGTVARRSQMRILELPAGALPGRRACRCAHFERHWPANAIRAAAGAIDRGGIWVNNGCRARFTYETAYDGGGYPGGYPGAGNQVTTVIKCESWNYQDARCPIDTRGGGRDEPPHQGRLHPGPDLGL
jgi:hypothetical protein